MKKTILLCFIILQTACASIVNDSHIALTSSFSDGSAGKCVFRNKRGSWPSKIPATVMIRRSDDALIYDCESEDGRKADGSIVSEMEGAKLMASVVFFDLGITDAITDKHRTYQGNIVIPLAPKKPSLESVASSASQTNQPHQKEATGKYQVTAEKLSDDHGCESPSILTQNPPVEMYQTICSGNHYVIKCEWNNCKIVN
jgi:hypothetical protein